MRQAANSITESGIAVVDVETTGFGRQDRVVEICILVLDPESCELLEQYDTLVNPMRDIGPIHIHGITPSMVQCAPTFDEIAECVAARLHGRVIIAHNAPFDTRMIKQEFDRMTLPIHMGRPICTYRATRQKLKHACENHSIPLLNAHSALSDAQATSHLASALGLHRKLMEHEAVQRKFAPVQFTHRTHRRNRMRVDESERSCMREMVEKSPFPSVHEKVGSYLHMLDWVLDDAVIDSDEWNTLDSIARDMGITPSEREKAHQDYFSCILNAVKRDGIVTPEESRLLAKIAKAMRLSNQAIPPVSEKLDVNFQELSEPGLRICFTGNSAPLSRDELEAMAENRGFVPVRGVTKRGCDMLVAADTKSQSSKTKNARRWGIPIISTKDFTNSFNQ